jgi:hypothetical protein
MSSLSIPLYNFPHVDGTSSTRAHRRKWIFELPVSNCISEFTCPPIVVNPLTVSVNSSGEERLVLELRHVNKFVDKQKVKFEGVNEALAFANNSKYMYTILNQGIII